MQGRGAVHSSLLSLNHDQRLNRNEHLDKGRFLDFIEDLIQISTKCILAKGKLSSMNLNSAKGEAKSLKQIKTSLKWYNFVFNLGA